MTLAAAPRDSRRRRPAWLRIDLALLAIVLLAVVVRVAWIASVNIHPFDGRYDDTVFYLASAQSLANSLEYRDNFGRLTALWPPGYSFIVAPVMAIFGDDPEVAKAVNVAAAAATCVLTYLLGAWAFGRRAGLIGALLVALMPGQIYFATLVMSEVVFGLLFLLLLVLLLRWTIERDARMPALLAVGALAGFAALTRAEALIFAATVPLLWKVALPGWRTTVRNTVFFGAGIVLALTPWTVRNAIHFHDFIPIRDNAGGALASALDPDYRTRPGGITGDPPALGDQAAYMAKHPWEFVPLQRDKLIDLYGDDRDGSEWIMHEVPPWSPQEAQRWSRIADTYYYAVAAWALFAIPLWFRRKPPARLVLAFGLLSWSAIELIFWPESRYHFAVMPVICVFAAALLVQAIGLLLRSASETKTAPATQP